MLLEKIRQHAGKLIFIALNGALVLIAFLWINWDNSQQSFWENWRKKKAEQLSSEAEKRLSDIEIIKNNQIGAEKYRNTKLKSIANNPDTIAVQSSVVVPRIIPAKTTVVSVSSTGTSSKSSSSSSSTSTKKTKTS